MKRGRGDESDSNEKDKQEEEATFHRDFHHLYTHSATLRCAAEDLCIPCLYKFFPDGCAFGVKLPPNQRPELCKRSSHTKTELDGLYRIPEGRNASRSILTVGDGDFSFSLSLAQSIHTDNFIATSYESQESVLSVYKNSLPNMNKLKKQGVTVKHLVDGKNIQESLSNFKYKDSFDFIIWNFPCIRITGGADAQVADIEENKDLVKRFFSSAKSFLKKQSSECSNAGLECAGEIHVTHKTFEPFCWWDILTLAAEAGLAYKGSLIFDRYLYPGYINRKALDNKSFPFFDAQTYIFSERPCDGNVLSIRDHLVSASCPEVLSILKSAVLNVGTDLSGCRKKEKNNNTLRMQSQSKKRNKNNKT